MVRNIQVIKSKFMSLVSLFNSYIGYNIECACNERNESLVIRYMHKDDYDGPAFYIYLRSDSKIEFSYKQFRNFCNGPVVDLNLLEKFIDELKNIAESGSYRTIIVYSDKLERSVSQLLEDEGFDFIKDKDGSWYIKPIDFESIATVSKMNLS